MELHCAGAPAAKVPHPLEKKALELQRENARLARRAQRAGVCHAVECLPPAELASRSALAPGIPGPPSPAAAALRAATQRRPGQGERRDRAAGRRR